MANPFTTIGKALASIWRRMLGIDRILAVGAFCVLAWGGPRVFEYLHFDITRLSPEEFEKGAAAQMTSLQEWYAYLDEVASPVHSAKSYALWRAHIEKEKRPVDWDAAHWETIFYSGKSRSDARWEFRVTRTELKSWTPFYFTIHPTVSQLLLGEDLSVVGYRK